MSKAKISKYTEIESIDPHLFCNRIMHLVKARDQIQGKRFNNHLRNIPMPLQPLMNLQRWVGIMDGQAVWLIYRKSLTRETNSFNPLTKRMVAGTTTDRQASPRFPAQQSPLPHMKVEWNLHIPKLHLRWFPRGPPSVSCKISTYSKSEDHQHHQDLMVLLLPKH